MGSMSSLGITVSGLRAAQLGLAVTGHNVANVHSPGFTRQMHFQNDFVFQTLRPGMQRGLGTHISEIYQIRCRFLDLAYRQNVGREMFHAVRVAAGNQLEVILGELDSHFKFQYILMDLHVAVNEVMIDTGNAAARGNFMAATIAFMTKADNVHQSTLRYQHNLNDQIIAATREINMLANRIHNLNLDIARNEASGDRANDLRDQRNLALDRLSEIASITYRERPGGRVDVLIEGNPLVVSGMVSRVGLRFTGPGTSFVEPVFTDSTITLEYDDNSARALFNFHQNFRIINGRNDRGELQGLMTARGFAPADYMSARTLNPIILAGPPVQPVRGNFPAGAAGDAAFVAAMGQFHVGVRQFNNALFDANHGIVTQFQKQFDTLINAIAEEFNYLFRPTAPADWPFDQHGNQTGVRLFELINPDYGYSLGNIRVNPRLVNPEGWALLPLSSSGDESDNIVSRAFLERWNEGFISVGDGTLEMELLNVHQFYTRMVATELGGMTNEAMEFHRGQVELVTQINFMRMRMSAVSLDEEMTNMMRFQHSYNAAARMLNVIDSMIDRIVNHTGRVGMR